MFSLIFVIFISFSLYGRCTLTEIAQVNQFKLTNTLQKIIQYVTMYTFNFSILALSLEK